MAYGLTTKYNMPPWRVDNHDILTGYFTSTSRCGWTCVGQSMTMLHNESTSIASHVVGLCIAVYLGYVTHYQFLPAHHATTYDHVMFVPLFLGSCAVFSMSAMYHILLVHSEPIKLWCARCDYTGIVAQITGGFITLLLCMFYTEPVTAWVYIGLHLVCVWAIMHMIYHCTHVTTNDCNTKRTVMFTCLACTLVAPLAHFMHTPSTCPHIKTTFLHGLVWFIGCTVVGAMLYVTHIPERWYPVVFDMCAHSHELMHWTIVVGAVLFYKVAWYAFQHGKVC